jgi:hypothetical protein
MPSEDYRQFILDEINKINDLKLEESTKKSLIRTALKDVLKYPEIKKAQEERKNDNEEKNK